MKRVFLARRPRCDQRRPTRSASVPNRDSAVSTSALICSHTVSIADIVGGNLNDLRFRQGTWESEFMANSGFYTNRIRYHEFLERFRQVGFVPEVYRIARWDTLPTPRSKMAPEFAALADAELQVSGFDVYLH
jgi:hypothetical protein